MPRPRNENAPEKSPFGDLPTVDDHPAAPPDVTPPLSAEDAARAKRLESMAREMPRSNTEVGLKMTGVTFQEIRENARQQLGGVESVREKANPKIDKYSPTSHEDSWQSPDAAALFDNVGENRTVVWPRRDGEYEGDRETVSELMQRIPEARIVTRKSDGEPVVSWDVQAVSIPASYHYRRILEEADRYEEWADGIDQQTQHGSITKKHRDRFEDGKERAAMAAEARSASMGVGQRGISETAGVPYMQALRLIPEEERLQTEARERAGGRHQALDERQAERIDQARAAQKGTQQFGGLAGNPRYNRWETSKDRQRQERGR